MLRRLLPMADEGLGRWGVEADERTRLLSIIEQRCVHRPQRRLLVRRAGQRAGSAAATTAPEALRHALLDYRELMHGNEPVHTWPV